VAHFNLALLLAYLYLAE